MRRLLERNAVGLALVAAEPLRAVRRALGGVRRRLRSLGGPRPGAERPIRVLIEGETLDRGGLEEAVFQLATHLDPARSDLMVSLPPLG